MIRRLALLACFGGACGAPHTPTLPGPQVSVAEPAADAAPRVDHNVRARTDLLALASTEPAQRPAAQHALFAHVPDALATFASVLDDPSQGPIARQAAAWVLGEADDARACAALDSAWLSSVAEPARFRVAIAVAAGRCEQFTPLLALAEHASEDDVRLKAAIALGAMAHQEAGVQISVLAGEVDPALADYATLALAMLGDTSAGEDIARTLDGGMPEAADIAGIFGLALYRSGQTDGVPEALRRAAVTHPDPVIRQAALSALVEAGDPYARTQLTIALSDPSPRVSHQAAAWLESLD